MTLLQYFAGKLRASFLTESGARLFTIAAAEKASIREALVACGIEITGAAYATAREAFAEAVTIVAADDAAETAAAKAAAEQAGVQILRQGKTQYIDTPAGVYLRDMSARARGWKFSGESRRWERGYSAAKGHDVCADTWRDILSQLPAVEIAQAGDRFNDAMDVAALDGREPNWQVYRRVMELLADLRDALDAYRHGDAKDYSSVGQTIRPLKELCQSHEAAYEMLARCVETKSMSEAQAKRIALLAARGAVLEAT